MSNAIDITGKKFGKLTVISRADNNSRNQSMWNCDCDCGNKAVVLGYALTSGKTKSCGCQRMESAHATHFEDLTGKRFGKLIVLERVENKKKRTIWRCKCDCGRISNVGANDLKNGTTNSCGCLRFESKNKTHGLSKTRLHGIWNKMRDRCSNEKNPAYKWYGDRGIAVCKEWLDDFMNFYSWAIENGYTDDLSIDRIDVNGNYEPSNCRWIPLKEQAKNTRATKFLTYRGETKTFSEWSEITGIKHRTLLARKKYGYTDEECIEIPLGQKLKR